MCTSEPNAGTDVLGMRTSAVFDAVRSGYVLNGTKMWITNGTLTGKETGDLFLVYARTGSEKRTNVVGDVDGATICTMRNLEIERVALAAMAVGIARRSLDEMIAYASDRPAFGRPDLFGFGQVQRHVAESYAEYMAGKSYLYGFVNGLDLDRSQSNLQKVKPIYFKEPDCCINNLFRRR